MSIKISRKHKLSVLLISVNMHQLSHVEDAFCARYRVRPGCTNFQHRERRARETEMMRARWKVFECRAHIPEEEQVEILPCGRCFAELIP